jgi:hypothetical protein
MHFKQQVRQPRSTAMNNKGCVHLAIIGHSVTLDEILEAYKLVIAFLLYQTEYL